MIVPFCYFFASKMRKISSHCKYRKVANTRLSWLVAHLRIFILFLKGEIWQLWTVIFGQKISKLNSRLVYYSQLSVFECVNAITAFPFISDKKWGSQITTVPPALRYENISHEHSLLLSLWSSNEASYSLGSKIHSFLKQFFFSIHKNKVLHLSWC